MNEFKSLTVSEGVQELERFLYFQATTQNYVVNTTAFDQYNNTSAKYLAHTMYTKINFQINQSKELFMI